MNHVQNSFESWNNTPVTKSLIEETVSYFRCVNENIEHNWLGNGDDTPYRNTYTKFKNYIEILLNEHNVDRDVVEELNHKINGLYTNWKESPLDQCIPVALKNYIYARNIFTSRVVK